MFKKLRKIATTKFAGIIFYWMIRLYSATFRLTIENEKQLNDYLEKGGKILVCLWHQQLFIVIRFLPAYKKYKPFVMISRSLDGDIASRIVEAGGVTAIRGSSSRDGKIALKEIIARTKEYPLAAHILDGPRGPAGIVKDGLIAIALATGAAVVPAYVSSDRTWYMRSWDRFMIPKPFARVYVKLFPLMELPPLKEENDFEKRRKAIEKLLSPYLHRG